MRLVPGYGTIPTINTICHSLCATDEILEDLPFSMIVVSDGFIEWLSLSYTIRHYLPGDILAVGHIVCVVNPRS